MGENIESCSCNIIHEDVVRRVRKKIPREETLIDLAELFKIFGDSTRIKIICALFVSEMCVCDIAALLKMNQSAISHQLRILKQARVFEEEAGKLGNIPFLAQGTIYPDVIESGGKLGATIKSHHNVGGLRKNLAFAQVIEPLAGLFKDEVRILGRKLGLPASITGRQPFPGPGLAIRIMGEVTQEKLEIVRKADFIMCEEIGKLKRKPQQYFAVYTGARSVGIKGDDRTYDGVIALRAVTTSDFMTCEYAPLSHQILSRISSRITREIPSVSRVVYDITSKPPATVEWE
jgi:GMP synthase (glutamine-hydrolysing)